MISGSSYDNQHPTKFKLPDGREIIVHQTFSKSGVYDASTLKPIWQVNWFALKSELLFSPNFESVVRINRFGFDGKSWGVSFYKEGQFVKSHNVDDLLTSFKNRFFLPLSTMDWHTRWYDAYEMKGDEIILSTAPRRVFVFGYVFQLGVQEFYSFDVATGIITKKRVVQTWYYWLCAFVILCGLVFVGLWLLLQRKPLAS